MKINAARKKFLLCFRPTVDVEPIVLGNKQPKRTKQVVSFPKTPSTTTTITQENVRSKKRSLSRFLKAVLFGNTLTKRIQKRRRSTKNPEPVLSEGQPTSAAPKKSDKDIKQTTTTLEYADFQENVCSPWFLDPDLRETNSGGQVGCFSNAAVMEQNGGIRQPERSKYMKRIFTKLVISRGCRYGIYTILAIIGVTVLWGRINDIFLTCIWLYLAGAPLAPEFSAARQPSSRRQTYWRDH